MAARHVGAILLSVMIVWLPASTVCSAAQAATSSTESEGSQLGSQGTSSVAAELPLTLEEEWSNAMIYADRDLLLGLSSLACGLTILGAGVYAVILGAGLLLPVEMGALGRSVLGAELCILGGSTAWFGFRFSLIVGVLGYAYLMNWQQLSEFGKVQGWNRQRSLVLPENPAVEVLVKPTDAIEDWIRILTGTEPVQTLNAPLL
jgi:hypothetical protein